MLKIIPSRYNKGFVYSSFLIAAIVLVSLGACLYFLEYDSLYSKTVTLSGKISDLSLRMEAIKSSVTSAAFVFYLDACSSSKNKTRTQLAEEIASKLDNYVYAMSPEALSKVSGNFSLFFIESSGILILSSNDAPYVCVNNSKVTMCSDLGIEKIIDEKWIH